MLLPKLLNIKKSAKIYCLHNPNRKEQNFERNLHNPN